MGIVHLQTARVVTKDRTKTLVIVAPGASEDGPTTYTAEALTISKMTAVLIGSASPSVTWTIRFASARNATGTEVVVGGTITTNISTGDDVVPTNANIPADSFYWVETTAQSGSVSELSVTLVFV